ncbi:hypothetical protein SSIG_06633 [Streptomyces filamentosus NRRL 11379]|nr:hypothetical protein SSIG_06633 [Streptomyces filamentosus NRRL 11379]
MPDDMSTTPAPDNSVEVRFGKKHRVRVGNVSERVQLEIIRGATALGLGALLVAYLISRDTQPSDEPAPVS